MNAQRQDHWNAIYSTKSEESLSWYELIPRQSLELILQRSPNRNISIVDVGGGSSHLVDSLLKKGFVNLSVVDISREALTIAQERLGTKAASVSWIESDVLDWNASSQMDLWHDRAAYHFFTEPADRHAYAAIAAKTVKYGGALILETFAIDGPSSCSGLPVHRASSSMVAEEFAPHFELLASREHQHTTPAGVMQRFLLAIFNRSLESER